MPPRLIDDLDELAPADGAEGLDFAEHDVSIEGETAVVTASHSGNNEGRPLEQSAAYVFSRGTEGWTQQQKLVPNEEDDASWRSVAVDGDRIVVGAENVGVHVWNRIGERWRHHATVEPANPDEGAPPPNCQPEIPCFHTPARFGHSVDLDGDTLVASTYPVSLFGSGNGPAYVFDTGEPAPTVGLVPGEADLGEVIVEEVSDSQTVLVENNGSADLELGELSLTGDHPVDFLLTDDFCSGRAVAPGRGCTFEVRFIPGSQSLGPRTAQVVMPSNAATGPDHVSVAGHGLPAPPAIDVAPGRLAVEAPEGTQLTRPFLVSNQGTVDLEWSVFPDPTAEEGLTLQPSGETTEVHTPPVELSQAGLARITTDDRVTAGTRPRFRRR